MVDKEKREQEAYERGYDIDESYGVSSAGKLPLSALEEERDELAQQNRKLRIHRRLWMVMALCSFLVLIALGVTVWLEQREKPGNDVTPTGAVTPKEVYRICKDTESKIREYNNAGGSYTASLRTVLDTEYVAFAYGDAQNPEYVLMYRNAYPSAADAKEGQFSAWMETTQMLNYEVPYTLEDDWSLLTPEPVIMGGTKYVLFVQEQQGIPRSVVVLEPGLMNVGREQDCFEAVRKWFTITLGSELTGQSSTSLAAKSGVFFRFGGGACGCDRVRQRGLEIRQPVHLGSHGGRHQDHVASVCERGRVLRRNYGHAVAEPGRSSRELRHLRRLCQLQL